MKLANIQVHYVNHMGSDLSVVNAARVSFNKESSWDESSSLVGEQILTEKDAKLIKFLAKHKHFSPFNHTFFTCRVKAPLFVARQLVKHKFMPWNEVSRRYVDDEPEFYLPDYWRKKADNVKQGSSEDKCEKVYEKDFLEMTDISWAEIGMSECIASYNRFIKNGVCPEQARMILPQNMMTEWYWSGTVGAFCDMLRLRRDPHTQKETRITTEGIHAILVKYFPVSVNALLEI